MATHRTTHNIMNENTYLVTHPLIQHKLTLMREKQTSSASFRRLLREISMLLGYEITRDLPLVEHPIKTPLESTQGLFLKGKKLCLISILRAGNGLLDGLLDLVPSARVGHVGLYRDPVTLEAVEYYNKMPTDIHNRPIIVVDPMLATGNSAIAALDIIKKTGATRLKFLCLLAAPEGIKNFHEVHPDVPVYTAAIDRELNDHSYILPGLGDAGDRIYGTR